jgi:hypothetical protein
LQRPQIEQPVDSTLSGPSSWLRNAAGVAFQRDGSILKPTAAPKFTQVRIIHLPLKAAFKGEPTMSTGTVRVHRVLRASPERVYRAFLAADVMNFSAGNG